ncbi:flagellin [Planktomarina temperata]|nr:flagellin [Planktomarina temperata]
MKVTTTQSKEKQMTSINAGGAFYRVQNAINENSERVSQSMQRLSSGLQNVAAGDRVASSAVAYGQKAQLNTVKVGVQNATEVVQALEMANNAISKMSELVVRLEELNALGENGFSNADDQSAIDAEGVAIVAEITALQTNAKYKGKSIFGGTTSVGVGKNNTALTVNAGAAITATISATKLGLGTAASEISTVKQAVDELQVTAGQNYNRAVNTLSQLSSLRAGYAIDVASKLDVDFAGETTELAKGQILAQAGTAMLAQANAQGQGLLALIQS